MKNLSHQSNYRLMKIVKSYLLEITLSKNYQGLKQKPKSRTIMTWINAATGTSGH